MFPILQLGPLAVQVPGLLLLAGVWIGLSLAEKEAARLGQNAEAIYNLVFTGLVAGLVGARVAYAGRYLSIYLADPLSLIALNPGTLAVPEGVLIGLTAAVVYGARRQLPLRATLDALAPATALMAVALALSHAASGDAFGAPARWPWSIFLWDDYRHPSQIYELAAALAVLGVWRRTKLASLAPGVRFLLVAALLAAARVFLEAFRGDSVIVFGGLRAAQVWGWVALAICLAGMHWWSQTGGREAGDRAS